MQKYSITERTPSPGWSAVAAASRVTAASLQTEPGLLSSWRNHEYLQRPVGFSAEPSGVRSKLKSERNFTFQHENDPKHVPINKAALHHKKISVPERPVPSPDLNPAKDLRGDLKRAVHRRRLTVWRVWDVSGGTRGKYYRVKMRHAERLFPKPQSGVRTSNA